MKISKNVWYEVIYFDTETNKNAYASMSSRDAIKKHFSTAYRKRRYKVIKTIKHG